MRSRRAAAAQSPEPPPLPEDGYRNLSVAEVLNDLPSLDPEQLLLVKSLEEACDGRPEILGRIDELLGTKRATLRLALPIPEDDEVVPEPDETLVRKLSRARPLRAHREDGVPAAANTAAAKPAAPKPAAPKANKAPKATKAPKRASKPGGRGAAPARAADNQPAESPANGSADLMAQMDGLLARDEVRRGSSMQAAWPMPAVDGSDPGAPTGVPGPQFWPEESGRRHRGGVKQKNRKDTAPATRVPAPGQPASRPAGQPAALIVPGDGRKPPAARGKGRNALAALVVVVVAGTVGAVYWNRTHQTGSGAAGRPPAMLVATLISTIPGGYVVNPGSTVSATSSALGAAVQDYRSTTAGSVPPQPAGFLAGVQRQWTSTADPSQAVWVFLMQFDSPASASAFATQVATATAAAANQVTATQRHQGTAEATFATAGVPGAIGSSNSVAKLAFARDVFTRGSFVGDVIADGPTSAAVVPVAQAAVIAQYAAMSGR